MRSVARLGFVVFALLLCSQAHAGAILVPTSQQRSIEVSAFAVDENQNDLRINGDLAPFNESLLVHPIRIVDGARYAAQAMASQTSQLNDDSFTFAGSIYAQSIHPANCGASAHAVFDVTFDVTEQANYSLDGMLKSTDGPTNGALALTLFDGSDVLFSTAPIASPFAQTGELRPGSYRLVMDAAGDGSGSLGAGIDYNVTFTAAPTATPIPLPPAIWSGTALMLLALAAAKTRISRAMRIPQQDAGV
jgi:type 1 fimbria pilin